MTPAGTSNELDVQNEWEENKQTNNKSRTLVGSLEVLSGISDHAKRKVPQGNTRSSYARAAARKLLHCESGIRRAELDDRLRAKCHLRKESRSEEIGRGSATESTGTRSSAKRDAEL